MGKGRRGNPRFNRITIILMGSRELIFIVFIFFNIFGLNLECIKDIIFFFFIDPDIFKCNLWCAMIEYFLQHGYIFSLFIEPIAEGFAHGVSPNGFDTGKISGFFQFSISLDLINGLISFREGNNISQKV